MKTLDRVASEKVRTFTDTAKKVLQRADRGLGFTSCTSGHVLVHLLLLPQECSISKVLSEFSMSADDVQDWVNQYLLESDFPNDYDSLLEVAERVAAQRNYGSSINTSDLAIGVFSCESTMMDALLEAIQLTREQVLDTIMYHQPSQQP